MLENAVGVIGGVGPMATVCFCELVLSMTYAERDQDHVNMIVLNHAAIPDRTAFICGASDDSPLPYMIADAKSLEKAGARFIVIPCNTAHYFFDEIAASVSVPVLNIVRETVLEAKRRIKGLEKLGVLATDGTLLTKSYELAANEQNIECVTPDEDVQRQVMSLVYDDVKAGKKARQRKASRLYRPFKAKGLPMRRSRLHGAFRREKGMRHVRRRRARLAGGSGAQNHRAVRPQNQKRVFDKLKGQD